MKVVKVIPDVALPGGLVRIEIEGDIEPAEVRAAVDDADAEIMGASTEAVMVRIPQVLRPRNLVLRNTETVAVDLKLGWVLADDLHAVANQVVDAFGNVFVTYSGSRGEEVPFSIFMISPEGRKEAFLTDITNPTGLAIGPDNYLYISSRHTGIIYRSTFDKRVEKFVEGVGISTGIVFDSQGNLLIGDRGGHIYRCTPDRQLTTLCDLEPSVAAYHLAIDGDDVLYVTGPTLSTQDVIYRITPEGTVSVFFKGLGRPQGLAFDAEGRLHVTASYRGRKGLYRFDGSGPELLVAGPMLVGLAYSHEGDRLYLVDNSRLYVVDL